MATIKLIKKTNKVWVHEPSDDLEFIFSKHYCKTVGEKFRVVEWGGSILKEYNVTDVVVKNIGGSDETFATAELLMKRLEALNYTGFIHEGDVVTADLISSDPSNAAIIGTDGGLFVPIISAGSDIIEVANLSALPATGESAKIYIAIDTNLQYRWSGSAYVQIGGNTNTNIKQRKKSRWWANGGTTATTLSQDLANYPPLYTGTKQNPATVVYANSLISSVPRLVYRSGAVAGSSCGLKTGGGSVYPFSTSTGYGLRIFFDTSDLTSVATSRISAGVTRNTGDNGNINPSSLLNSILVGNDTGDTNLWLMHNDGTGTCTRVDLGANFPHNNPNLFYELVLFAIPNATEVEWTLNRYQNSPIIKNPLHTTSGKIITDLPISGALCWFVSRNNGTTASAVEVGLSYVENEIFY